MPLLLPAHLPEAVGQQKGSANSDRYSVDKASLVPLQGAPRADEVIFCVLVFLPPLLHPGI